MVRSYLRDVSRSLSSVHRLVVGSRAGRWGARRGVEPVRPETSRNGSYVCVRMCVCVCVCVCTGETHAMAFSMFMYRVPRGTLVSPFVFQVTRHLRHPSTSTSTSTYPACHLVIPSLSRLLLLHSIASASRSQPLNRYLDIASR